MYRKRRQLTPDLIAESLDESLVVDAVIQESTGKPLSEAAVNEYANHIVGALYKHHPQGYQYLAEARITRALLNKWIRANLPQLQKLGTINNAEEASWMFSSMLQFANEHSAAGAKQMQQQGVDPKMQQQQQQQQGQQEQDDMHNVVDQYTGPRDKPLGLKEQDPQEVARQEQLRDQAYQEPQGQQQQQQQAQPSDLRSRGQAMQNRRQRLGKTPLSREKQTNRGRLLQQGARANTQQPADGYEGKMSKDELKAVGSKLKRKRRLGRKR